MRNKYGNEQLWFGTGEFNSRQHDKTTKLTIDTRNKKEFKNAVFEETKTIVSK